MSSTSSLSMATATAAIQPPTQVADNYHLNWSSYLSNLNTSVNTICRTEKFADVMLFSSHSEEDTGIPAHKIVLSSSSQFFATMFDVQLKSSGSQSGLLYIVLPPELSRRAIEILVQYMYSGDVTVPKDILQEVLLGGNILKIRGLWRHAPPMASTNVTDAANNATRLPSPPPITPPKYNPNQNDQHFSSTAEFDHPESRADPHESTRRTSDSQLAPAAQGSSVIVRSPHNLMAATSSTAATLTITSASTALPSRSQNQNYPDESLGFFKAVLTSDFDQCNSASESAASSVLSPAPSVAQNEMAEFASPAAGQPTASIRLIKSAARATHAPTQNRITVRDPESLRQPRSQQFAESSPDEQQQHSQYAQPPIFKRPSNIISPPPPSGFDRVGTPPLPPPTATSYYPAASEPVADRPPRRTRPSSGSFFRVKDEPIDWHDEANSDAAAAAAVAALSAACGDPHMEMVTVKPEMSMMFNEDDDTGTDNGNNAADDESYGDVRTSQAVELTVAAPPAASSGESGDGGVAGSGGGGNQMFYTPLSCELCSRTFSQPADWVRHIEDHSKAAPSPSAVATTSAASYASGTSEASRYTSVYGLLGKKRKRNEFQMPPTVVQPPTSNIASLRCDLCLMLFVTPAEWVRHVQSSHTECELAISNQSNQVGQGSSSGSHSSRAAASPRTADTLNKLVRTAMSAPPPPPRPLSTIGGGRTTVTLATVATTPPANAAQFHSAASNVGAEKLCSICRKSFPSYASMIIHKRSHTGERPYFCRVCQKGFNVKSNLLRHVRSQHFRLFSAASAGGGPGVDTLMAAAPQVAKKRKAPKKRTVPTASVAAV